MWRRFGSLRMTRACRGAKIVAGMAVAYALSPIDLIPDFIPVLGYFDDLILVPIGLWLAMQLIPSGLMAEATGRLSSSRFSHSAGRYAKLSLDAAAARRGDGASLHRLSLDIRDRPAFHLGFARPAA